MCNVHVYRVYPMDISISIQATFLTVRLTLRSQRKALSSMYYPLRFVVFARIIAIKKKRGKFAQRIYCIFYICFDSRSLIANHVK